MKYPVSFSANIHNITEIRIGGLSRANPPSTATWRWIVLVDETGTTHELAIHGNPEIHIAEESDTNVICRDWKPKPPLLDDLFKGLQEDLDHLKAAIRPEAD